jgi:uncharacterized HAD superfamily protein
MAERTLPILAIDADDVLADNAAGFVAFSNRTWGTELTVADYTEDWATMWGVDMDEVDERSKVFHASDTVLHYAPDPDALPVLTRLRDCYDLRVVTSRRRELQAHTGLWIATHFSDIFSNVHYSGIFDDFDDSSHLLTKGDIYEELPAAYAVDDQLKHCFAALERRIPAVLFGNRPWNQAKTLPKGVERCENWKEVEEYLP